MKMLKCDISNGIMFSESNPKVSSYKNTKKLFCSYKCSFCKWCRFSVSHCFSCWLFFSRLTFDFSCIFDICQTNKRTIFPRCKIFHVLYLVNWFYVAMSQKCTQNFDYYCYCFSVVCFFLLWSPCKISTFT